MRSLVGAILILLCIIRVESQPWYDQEEFVPIDSTGGVLGEIHPKGRAFRGVPYAAPPIGKNGRWKAPQPFKTWGPDPLFTRDYKPGCIQRCEEGVGLPPHACPQFVSEDCLYLNVYTPRNVNSNSNLPVLVWFPGGNFDKGMANLLYEGIFIANQTNTIVVAVTYRVGALGFLVAPGINGGNIGNFGILDQRQSLIWVRDNIRSFGGDPNQVTIFGQSAGGRSVSIHMISPLSEPLFNKAIIMSDPMHIVLSTEREALDLAIRFGEAVGCDTSDTACLYQLDPEEIIFGQEEAVKYVNISKPISTFMQLVPTIDGYDIPGQPLQLFYDGTFHLKPVIVGTVYEETVIYIYSAWGEPVDAVSYRLIMAAIFKENDKKVLDLYPAEVGNPDQRDVMSVVGTHYTFSCPSRLAARGLAKKTNTWVYAFDHYWSFDGWGENFDFCRNRVCHGADMPIAFDTAQVVYETTKEEDVLSSQMIQYFGNFAHTSDPNKSGSRQPTYSGDLPFWPSYNQEIDETIRFATPQTFVESNYLKENCDMFDEVGYDPMKMTRATRYLFERKQE